MSSEQRADFAAKKALSTVPEVPSVVTTRHHTARVGAMPRWEQGSADRLTKAALELFEEQGFENASVVEIADRARVTTRTFFRYFPDKREVLFAESDRIRTALVQAILDASDVTEPLQVVTTVLAEFDWSVPGIELQRRRHAVIAGNPGLLEHRGSMLAVSPAAGVSPGCASTPGRGGGW